jgi:sortase A
VNSEMDDFENALRATLAGAERAAPAPFDLIDQLVASPSAAGRPARPTGIDEPSRWVAVSRLLLRGAGQALVSAGVVVLLFVAYEVYVTNYFAHAEQAAAKRQLVSEWTDSARDPLLPLPQATGPKLPDGKGIAFLYIPRLGRDYSWAIVEGVSGADLEKGPGHYKGTALPGALGNFAIAGHRVGKGEPFLNLDHLKAGDAVIVQTKSAWFIYRVKGGDHNDIASADADGVPGREIVSPSDGAVLDDVPDQSGVTATEALMTMTTCNPKFTAKNRMVVHAELTATVRANGTTMPAAVLALYKQGKV